MGGRHSRGNPPIPISIPNFPYPSNIMAYLMSQSKGYSITFTTPTGNSGNMTMPSSITPADTTPSTLATSAPTTVPVTTSPPPAYSTTLAPSSVDNTYNANNTSTPDYKMIFDRSFPNISPGVPPFWIMAIWAMVFVNVYGPITSYDKLQGCYSKLADTIKMFLGDGKKNANNVGVIILFSTVISLLFQPFTANFTYNYLSVNFPMIFNDMTDSSGKSVKGAVTYSKVVMINYYAKHTSDLLGKYGNPVNGYISINDRVMLYTVPTMMNAIIDTLNDVDPLASI